MKNDLSQKYCDEIMKYYNQQKKNNTRTQESSYKPEISVPVPEEPVQTDLKETVISETAAEFEENTAEKYPDPDISKFILTDDYRSAVTEKSVPSVESDYGSLRIEATAGSHAIPVEDALIIITRADKPKEEIVAVLLTDSSGTTQTIKIPAPAEILSESPSDNTVSAVVNITAYKKGYYEIENRNVPVFTGVTSIQPVNMIPLPINSSERKAVFTEDEPNL